MKPFYAFRQLGVHGRLGNQLWQYACVRALALKNDCDVRVPFLEHRHHHGQQCLLEKHFNVNIKPLTWRESTMIERKYNELDPFKFDEQVLKQKPYTDLFGFFQSIDYFKDVEQQIKKELTPKDIKVECGHTDPISIAKLSLGFLKVKHQCSKIISMHMRRGDNTDNSNPAQYEVLKQIYGVGGNFDEQSIYGQYFDNARQYFNDDCKFLIFTGGSRNGKDNEDYKWCRENFRGEEFLFADEVKTNPNIPQPILDFCLIAACDGNIVSHLSSFGWWATYIGDDGEKKIVCPQNYHCDRIDIDHRQGFYPERWIKV